MPAFPSTREILGELVGFRSYTPPGRRAIAEYIAQFARRWSLGEVRLVEYPARANGANASPKPCNVVIDIGQGTDETVLVHGHFDKIPPDDYPPDFHRDPDQLIPDPEDPDICYGLGSNDMLGSIAGMLEAARAMRVAHHRKVRLLMVDQEENQSQGTHAALHPDCDLVGDACCVVSNEIAVGGTLADRANLYIGRTGRVGLNLTVFGPAMHSGRVRREMFHALAASREAKARLALENIRFSEHPNDPLRLMPESMCIPGDGRSGQRRSLSVPRSWHDHIDVFYSDPRLDPAAIQHIVWRAIRDCLGDENFSLTYEEGRELPFTKPWLEEPFHPFVLHCLGFAEEVCEGPVQRKAARGVADESIMVHAKHIPAICFPPEGEDEHIRDERVRISSVTRRIVPFLRKVAAFGGRLTNAA